MKKYELKAYWTNGDTYSTVCTDGLDNGDSMTAWTETAEQAEEMIMGMLDPDFVDAVESDPEFRFWKAEEAEQ